MEKTCIGCGHIRTENDDAVPEWECPGCSHAYNKLEQKYAKARINEGTVVKSKINASLINRVVFVTALCLVIFVYLYKQNSIKVEVPQLTRVAQP